MRTLNATAQNLVNAESKRVDWLFDVSNQYLNFDASVGTFTAGNTITGEVSEATATIDKVVYTSHTAGKLMLSSISGTFQDDEAIYESALGGELLTNIDFANWTTDNPDDWIVSGEVANDPEVSEVGTGEGHGGVGSGMCNIYNTDGSDLVYIRQADLMTVGKYYKAEIKVDTVVAGGITINTMKVGGAYPTYTTTGSKSVVGISTGVNFTIKRKTSTPSNVTIDDVSLKKVTNYAIANGTVQGSQYYWSTKAFVDSTVDLYFDEDRLYFEEDSLEFGAGQAYSYKIIPSSFNGLTIRSPLSQYGTYAPNILGFEITNSGNSLTASDFVDASVYLKLILSDGSNTEIICRYKYIVEKASSHYQKIRFECKDFLAKQIEGNYPNTPLVNDVFPPGNTDLESINTDPFCIAVPFGTCYIPIRCILDSTYARGYVLGSADYTYTVSEVSSPRSFEAKQSWTTVEADFRQVTKADRLGPYLNFDASTGSFTIGNTITGATSDATATIDQVFSSGTTGTLVLSSISGTFQDDEIIYESALGSELVTNGNCELDANWNDENTPTVNERSNEQAHGGTYSRKYSGDAWDGIESDAFTSSTVTGSFYILNYWVYPVDLTRVYIQAKKGAVEENNVSESRTGLTPNAWNEDTRIYQENNGGAAAAVRFLLQDSGVHYIDDVSVKNVTNAALANGIVQNTDVTPNDYKVLHPFLIKMDANNYAGVHDGGDDKSKLTDSTASWTVDELIGLRVINSTTGEAGYITDNDGTTVTATLSGDDWDDDDAYYITASGLWKQSGTYQDILAKFSRSDTSSTTCPADHLEFVMEDMGVGTDFIDTGVGSTFATASTTYSGWGLTYNGAYYYKRNRAKVIAEILNCCHSTIDVDKEVKLRVLSKTSQKTLTDADILRRGDGEGTFNFSYLTQQENDSGYVSFQESGEPQDVFLKALVTAKNTTNNPSSEVLNIPFVQDSQDAQRIGTLYYQRKCLKEANITFEGKTSLLPLQPNDVITINHTNYGGSFDVVIESMTVNREVTGIQFRCVKYKYDLDDWDDLSPSAISLATDNNVSYWIPLTCGPDAPSPASGNIPHVIPGPFRVGSGANYVYIDPSYPHIKLFATSERLRIGNLNGILDYATNVYGFAAFKDATNYVAIDPTNGVRISASSADAVTVKSGGSIKLEAGGDIILVGSDTDPGMLFFQGSSYNVEMGMIKADGSEFGIFPTTDDVTDFRIGCGGGGILGGGVAREWTNIIALADGYISLAADDDIFVSQSNFRPGVHKSIDLGEAAIAWDDAYADDWHNVADFFYLDSFDDLAELHKIKGSGIIDSRTGLELIDDNSLPEWMLSKAKDDYYTKKHYIDTDKEIKPQKVKLLFKKGDVLLDPDGKPYISLKASISHLWGCVKQLDKKVDNIGK